MQNLIIYKVICAIMAFTIICGCSSDNILNIDEPEVSARSNDMRAGPCCPYHLTEPCPDDCFSSGGYHECLNPEHMGLQKYNMELGTWDECGGCREDGGGITIPIPTPTPKYCDACETCQACIHNRKYMDENGNNNGNIPYQPYLHTCRADMGGCQSCICCKDNNILN